MADKKSDDQDLSAYIGTDPIYMNSSDDRNKPFRAEEDGKLKDDEAKENKAAVEAEDRAYEVQAQIRESAGQDPETGEVLEEDPEAFMKAKREGYTHAAGWTPNQASAMTDPANDKSDSAPASTETGSTEEVKSDGETTPSAPAAPAAKKAASSSNKS